MVNACAYVGRLKLITYIHIHMHIFYYRKDNKSNSNSIISALAEISLTGIESKINEIKWSQANSEIWAQINSRREILKLLSVHECFLSDKYRVYTHTHIHIYRTKRPLLE